MLMKSLSDINLFNGYKVGRNDLVSISHFQFADDTLILGEKSWANIFAMRAVLIQFQDLSGLKVNFLKSLLVGVNVPDSWLTEAAMVMNCKVGSIPFMYLGLPIGGDARRRAFRDPLLKRINFKLSRWSS